MYIIEQSRGQGHPGVKIDREIVGKLGLDLDSVQWSSYNYNNLREGLVKTSLEAYAYMTTKAQQCSMNYERSLTKDYHSILMGGDHLTSFATVLASLRRFGNNFRLVWLDAHTDIHSFNSSPSWNLHGMVVRMLMEHTIVGVPRLKPEQIIYIGIRSYEPAEMSFILEQSILRITIEDWKARREQSMNKLGSFIIGHNIHLSFDVDALDPAIMSSTGTPEPNGLNVNDFKDIIDILRQYGYHYATDIMEFNPSLGDFSNSLKTLKEVVEYLHK